MQTNLQTGDQFSIETGTEKDDAWCQNPTNVVKPVMSFMVCRFSGQGCTLANYSSVEIRLILPLSTLSSTPLQVKQPMP